MKLLATALLFTSFAFGQKDVFLSIHPKNAGVDLQMTTDIPDLVGNYYNLDHFDYYVSNVTIVHDGGQILNLEEEVYLFEPENYTKYLGYMDVNTIEEIRFGIGVPENLNTINGADAIDISAYPTGHPLSFQDPAMHWGWSAGYMFMIIGGDADSNGDDIPDTYFEVHSLGSQNYADVVVPITTTSNNGNQIDIHLNCNVDVWMTNVTPATVGILHGTTGVNAMVLKNPENHPVFTQSEAASVSEINTTAGKSWFNSSMESMTIYWEGYKDLSRVEMVDINGRLVKTSNQSNVKGNVLFEGLAPGTYLVNFINSDNVRFATLNVAK